MVCFYFLNALFSKLDFSTSDILFVQFSEVLELFEVVTKFHRADLNV